MSESSLRLTLQEMKSQEQKAKGRGERPQGRSNRGVSTTVASSWLGKGQGPRVLEELMLPPISSVPVTFPSFLDGK